MRVCPVCHATYSVAQGFCPMDGTALTDPVQAAGSGPGDDPMLGRVLDQRYRLDECIGTGGMGIVYRATHVVIEKPVAIKILKREHAKNPDIVRRFLQEARLASRIKQPNVVDISDYGELEEGGAYYVMEYLAGHNLAQEIAGGGKLVPRRALNVATQIAHGLSAAHGRDVVHRDLKPDNVFLCPTPDGQGELVKLLDFGIARIVDHDASMTEHGTVMGTPEYMSPEQAQGDQVDHRTDLYALGAITFEMLTGQVPLEGDTVVATLTKQIFDAPPLLHQVDPGGPTLPRTQRVIDRLLAKARDERPVSSDEVIHMLRQAAEEDLLETGQRRAKSTVELGSGSLEENRGAATVMEAGPMPALAGPSAAPLGVQVPIGSPPAPVASVSPSDEIGKRRPSVIVREGTPAEHIEPRPPLGSSSAHMHRRSPPVVLLVAGAAVCAGLATVGVFKLIKGRAAAVVEDVSAPSQTEEAVQAGSAPQLAAPAVASDPPPPPKPVGEPAASPTPGEKPPDETADARSAGAESEGKTGPDDAGKSARRGRKGRSKTKGGKPQSRESGASQPGKASPKEEPADAPSVSLGDLKDPFSSN